MARVHLELPVDAAVGPLVDPEVGIAAVKTRAGTLAEPPITVIDTADLRLLAAGVVVAHRHVDRLGEWVLASAGWEPYLPAELVEPFGHGDLPDEFSSLTRPFRRTAPLGVQGSLAVESRSYDAVSATGEVLATLVDARTVIRRGTEIVRESRSVRIAPGSGGPDQLTWLVHRLKQAGGTPAARRDGLVALLRPLAPPSDYVYPDRIGPEILMRDFAPAIIRRRLRRILRADLAFRTGMDPAPAELYRQLARSRETVEGVAWASSVDTSELLADLDWLLARPGAAPFGERYLTALDRIVAFARDPGLGDWGDRPAAAALAQEIDKALVTVVDRARRLDRHSPASRWEKTRASALHCLQLTLVSRRFFGARARGLRRRLEEIVAALDDCLPEVAGDPDLAGLSVAEAYEAGRSHERRIQGGEAARVHFIADWPDHHRYFKRIGIKP